MLDFLAGLGGTSSTKDSKGDVALKRIYTATLECLIRTGNERMWIKTKMKLAKLYIEQQNLSNAQNELQQLEEVCTGTSTAGGANEDDNTKSTFLMEVYALMMQLHSTTNNHKKVKEIYNKTMSIKSAISHPRILGVIHEIGGKINMREKRWEAARENLFESFKNYDEAGSLQRIQVLKYFVLACMLSESGIDPFESQETKPYKNDPKITVMMHLVEAFQLSDVDQFNKLLRSHKHEIMGDPLIRLFLDDVILSIRSQGVINLVRPYTRVSLQHIATALEITLEQAKEIVFKLILDMKLPSARIDQTNNVVELKGVTGKTESLRLAPLSNATDVPVLLDGKLRPLPVSLAHSTKLAKQTIFSEDQDLAFQSALRASTSNSSSGLKDNRSGDSAEQPDPTATGSQPGNDDTKVTGGNESLSGTTESGNKHFKIPWDEPEFNYPQKHHRDMVLGTSLVLSADFAAFPKRYARAIADEASIQSGKLVVGGTSDEIAAAEEKNEAAGAGKAGAGAGTSTTSGTVSGGGGGSSSSIGNGSIGGAGSRSAQQLPLLELGGVGADGFDEGSQTAALQEWVEKMLNLQTAFHNTPHVRATE
ncbi:hypothetical protein D0Z00_001677 [Geotrichum galactomycetum]|uniref:Uncharacterized protein n=1 Tax=Geotrichum galactomycetum TaxID=27317 RepID=A0ACB6V6B4_9ASCO|nr:hypothetical protein D0Z00_001677 [Geotrichum candidum]